MGISHTPGPWELIHFGGPQIGNKASGEAVCTMWGDEDSVSDPIHANTRLIAAAPDLLDELDCRIGDLVMLRKAIDAGDPKRELLVRIDDMLRETRAAISKATSRQLENRSKGGFA